MTKRLISSVLVLLLFLGIVPFTSISASAADKNYNVSQAIKYAQKNWNNGIGLCANFASKCLQAGGVDVFSETVKPLYDQLNGKYGKAYKLKLTGGTRGTVKMSDNEGKLSKGDPIFYRCNKCGDFEHVVICNGANSSGYSQDYAHNNAHNGKKQTYTYSHCGGDSWTLYSIKMYTGNELFGAKSSVKAPKITTIANGADGVVVKWDKIGGADYYRLYRKTDDSSWERVSNPKTNKFTDKKAENGVKYTYTVRAVDGKNVSQYYAGESVVAIASPKLTAPVSTGTAIKLTWSKVGNADGYLVYRRDNGGDWVKIANIKSGSKVSFTDKKVENNVEYTYTVRAYDGKVKGSYISAGKKLLFLDTPAELGAQSASDGIILTYPLIEGAKGYRIYRKNDAGKWIIIADLNDISAGEYIDTDVAVGNTYTYTVRAFCGKSFSYYNKTGVTCEHIDVVPELPEEEIPEDITTLE